MLKEMFYKFKKYKLTTRKWIIQDGDKINVVTGEGVIGYFPNIYPKC
jgi:uncharacterized protein affecting Mg2+/Co2+ transport